LLGVSAGTSDQKFEAAIFTKSANPFGLDSITGKT
jgi:hypothetical protein